MSVPEAEVRVHVNLGPRSYHVVVVSGRTAEFGAYAKSALESSWAGRSCRRALVVSDEHVARITRPYLDALQAVGIATSLAIIPPGEGSKTLDRAADLYDELVKLRADRHTAIVAVPRSASPSITASSRNRHASPASLSAAQASSSLPPGK